MMTSGTMKCNTDHAPEFVIVPGSLYVGKSRGPTFDAICDLFRGRHTYDRVERVGKGLRKKREHGGSWRDPYWT